MPLAHERLQACSARLSADGRKIVLGPGTAAWTEFCQSLPGARWSQFDCRWTCDFTPAAAWRIGYHGQTNRTHLSEELIEAASRFAVTIRQAASALNQKRLTPPPVFKTTPWDHQKTAFWFAYPLDATMLAEDMGVGKTLTAVDLVVNWGCKTILILCPLSVRGVWKREIDKHAGRPIAVCIPTKGSTKSKTREAESFLAWKTIVGETAAVVMNYDAAKMEPFASWSLGREWDCVILDESHRAKAHNSQTSKYCAKLGRKAKRRLCLTGTPLAQSPLDLFGQFRFLDPGLFGTSWHHFSNRYAIKGNPYIPQQITGYKNQEELQERFRLISYRCKASDVLDLPEAMHEERTCELSPAARKAYKQLEEELIAEVRGSVCTVANCLTRLLRLQQISSGFIILDEEIYNHTASCGKTSNGPAALDGAQLSEAIQQSSKLVELDDGKEALLKDLLEDAASEPFVVFCRFRHDLLVVARVCAALKLRYGELSGSLKDGLTDRGEMSPSIDLLGCQIQSGGVGIDLTRARYAVYYSLGFSLSEYEQSLARLHRPGQKRNVCYYHLIAEGTVDRRVYGALRSRKDVIEAVLEGMKE